MIVRWSLLAATSVITAMVISANPPPVSAPAVLVSALSDPLVALGAPGPHAVGAAALGSVFLIACALTAAARLACAGPSSRLRLALAVCAGLGGGALFADVNAGVGAAALAAEQFPSWTQTWKLASMATAAAPPLGVLFGRRHVDRNRR